MAGASRGRNGHRTDGLCCGTRERAGKRLGIETALDYDFAEPADVLLALEPAEMPDQHVVEQSLTVQGAGPVSSLGGGSAVGRRAWTHAGVGRMTLRYQATVEVERIAPDLSGLRKSPLPDLPE